MTIIAMLKESDELLYIGADSQWTDSEGLRFYKSKLQNLYENGKAIAWGTSGNPQIGITEFGNWITKYNWTGYETWTTFIIEVATEFARLNRIRKKIGEEAGQNISAPDFTRQNLCEMLMCGWLNNETGAYTISHNGIFQSIDTLTGFLTTGTGAPFAEAVYLTQRYFEKRLALTGEEIFKHTMALTSRHGSQCSLPFEVIKISPGEVSQCRSKEPELELEEMTSVTQSETDSNEA